VVNEISMAWDLMGIHSSLCHCHKCPTTAS